MNGRQLTIAGFVALLAAVAANGKAALEAFAALPLVLRNFATALPMGVWSFMLSLTIATLVWAHLDRIPEGPRQGMRRAALRAEMIALLIGITITMLQTIVGWPKSASELLNALLLGILAGLLAPFIGKIAAATWRKVIA